MSEGTRKARTDAGVEQDADRGAHAQVLGEDDLRGGESAYRNAEKQRRGGHDPAGPP